MHLSAELSNHSTGNSNYFDLRLHNKKSRKVTRGGAFLIRYNVIIGKLSRENMSFVEADKTPFHGLVTYLLAKLRNFCIQLHFKVISALCDYGFLHQ